MTRPPGLDRIRVSGIRATGRHGVLPHERRDGQEFVVDIDLALDVGPAADTDDLSRTVDYGSLSEEVHGAITSEPVDLIETLAQRIADLVLLHDLVQWAQVTVHKPAAPITVAFEDVAVTIERSRS